MLQLRRRRQQNNRTKRVRRATQTESIIIKSRLKSGQLSTYVQNRFKVLPKQEDIIQSKSKLFEAVALFAPFAESSRAATGCAKGAAREKAPPAANGAAPARDWRPAKLDAKRANCARSVTPSIK